MHVYRLFRFEWVFSYKIPFFISFGNATFAILIKVVHMMPAKCFWKYILYINFLNIYLKYVFEKTDMCVQTPWIMKHGEKLCGLYLSVFEAGGSGREELQMASPSPHITMSCEFLWKRNPHRKKKRKEIKVLKNIQPQRTTLRLLSISLKNIFLNGWIFWMCRIHSETPSFVTFEILRNES